VDVSNTTHTHAGTYASDSWSFTGTANYQDIGATTITDEIDRADAVIAVTGYNVSYDGQAHTATGTATGAGGENLSALLILTGTTHTAAGSYPTDPWSFPGDANHNSDSGTVADNIDRADAVVVVTPYDVVYDGQPHTATVVSITGVNGETGATVGTVDVSNTTHTHAGTYASDSWSFTGTANYQDIGATTIADEIDKASATFTVTGYDVVYDGQAHTATVSAITGVNGETGATVGTVDVSNTTHTHAGTYATDYWTFTGTANYKSIGSTAIADAIQKANASFTVTPYHVQWDGNPHLAAVSTIIGVNGETGATVGTVNVSNTAHTSIGTYSSDYWNFTGTANYNNIGNTTITDVITTAYCFSGFLSPIGGSVEAGNGGSFADPVRAFKLGSTIPVKFILNSWNGSTCGAVVTTGIHTLQAFKYSNTTDADFAINATPTDAATTGNQFRLTGTEWHFNLSTKSGFTQGTWLLKATLLDGSEKTVWVTMKK
jgi:hypothetical protein